jgi:hypothetical protein
MQRAVVARRVAIEAQVPPEAVAALYDYGPSFVAARSAMFEGLSPTVRGNRRMFNEWFYYGEMYGAAVDLLDAIAAAELARFQLAPTSSVATSSAAMLFAADTPVGRIAIGDGESGIYDSSEEPFAGAWALLVDLGGNDSYRVPVAGNVSLANSVSVLIDLATQGEHGLCFHVAGLRDGAGSRVTFGNEDGRVLLRGKELRFCFCRRFVVEVGAAVA